MLPGNLGAGIIDSSKISASAVTAEKIKNNVVTGNKITNGAVTSQKIAAAGVGTTNLAEKAVTTAKLNDGAVTAAKLAPEVLNNVQTLKTGQTAARRLQPRRHQGRRRQEAERLRRDQLPAGPGRQPGGDRGRAQRRAFTAQCPGLGGGNTTPEAAAGVVCVYLTTETNLEGVGPAARDRGSATASAST